MNNFDFLLHADTLKVTDLMMEKSLDELTKSWIRFHDVEGNLGEHDPDFWSFDCLSDWCDVRPDYAWDAIIKIYSTRPSEKVLSNLAAGPIEDLIVHHGQIVLGWIDQYCNHDANFVKVLQMVWRNAIEADVWAELTRLIKKYSS